MKPTDNPRAKPTKKIQAFISQLTRNYTYHFKIASRLSKGVGLLTHRAAKKQRTRWDLLNMLGKKYYLMLAWDFKDCITKQQYLWTKLDGACWRLLREYSEFNCLDLKKST